MKSRLPASTADYVGYTEELKSALSSLEKLPVLLVSGLPGSGKSEFVLRVSETFLARSSLKPVLIELRQAITLKELYLELQTALPKKSGGDALPASDIRDSFGDLLADLEAKKKWIIIENTHELNSDSVKWLVSAGVRYLRNSRLILTSREEFEPDALEMSEIARVSLGGLDPENAEKFLKGASLERGSLNNPALLKILAAGKVKRPSGGALEDWLMRSIPQDLQEEFRAWLTRGSVDQKLFKQLDSDLKAKAKRLARAYFLIENEQEISINPALLPIFGKSEASAKAWAPLIAAAEPGLDQDFYRLKAGESLPDSALKPMGESLIQSERIGAFFELQDSLRRQGRGVEELEARELELAVELHHFARAESIAQKWFGNLDSVQDLGLLGSLCNLSYQAKNHEVFAKVAALHFERSKKSPAHRVQAAHWQALAKREGHLYQEARRIREEAIAAGAKNATPKALFDIHFHLGIDCYWQADYDGALKASQRAREIAEQNGTSVSLQKALYNLSVFAAEIGKREQARESMEALKESLAKRPQPSLEVSVGIAEAVWLSDGCKHVSAAQRLESIRRLAQTYGSQNQQISLELMVAEMSLRAGLSGHAQSALRRASQLIEVRGLSQYRWRLLRLKAELDFARGARAEVARQLEPAFAMLSECEDLRERICLARLTALSSDHDKIRAQSTELARKLATEKKIYEFSYGQIAFETEASIGEGKPTDPVAIEKLEKRTQMFPYEAGRAARALAWLYWENERYSECRSLATEGLKGLSASEAPMDYAWALALQCIADLALGDWNQLLRGLSRLDELRGSLSDPSFEQIRAVLWCCELAAGLASTNEVAFFEGIENLRTRYASLDSRLKGLIERVIASLGKSLGLADPQALMPALVQERAHLVALKKQMKCVTLEGKLVNLASKPLLMDLLNLFLDQPEKRWSKEAIAETIWKEEYNPLRHDQLIYVNLGRLKKLIEPKSFEDSVIVNLDFSYALNSGAKIKVL